MGIFIVIVIFVIILVGFSGKPKQQPPAKSYVPSGRKIPPAKVTIHVENQVVKNTIVNALLGTLNEDNNRRLQSDENIIDITGQAQQLPVVPVPQLVKYAPGVPYWAHQYVYSYDEILEASREQQQFYNQFRDRFIKGDYLDLEGNSNYIFILLFDLANWYEKNRNLFAVKDHFEAMALLYPKTSSYVVSAMLAKARTSEEIAAIQANLGHLSYNYPRYNSNAQPDYWKTGTKYKTKLQLNEKEVAVLDRLSYLNNNFTNIEFCFMEAIRVFLSALEELSDKNAAEGYTYDIVIAQVADVVLQKQFRYKYGTHNYMYGMESVSTELYANIFKRCENTVREHYGHKRKVNIDISYTAAIVKEAFETRIAQPLASILPGLVQIIKAPDEATEIELFAQNTARWKINFESLTEAYKPGSGVAFTESILALGKLNAKNPSVENIFFEASKFIAKTDKQQALVLYIYYLHHDLNSETFDNKQLTKTIQKNLFTTTEQLQDFEQVVSSFVQEKDIEKAIAAVSTLYAPKRKKIALDAKSIKEAEKLHSGTVELLNEYLQDDFEDQANVIKTTALGSDEIKMEIIPKNETQQFSLFLDSLSFTPVQSGLLELFAKSNFSIEQGTVSNFAKSNGVFAGQLIESINDTCYESLDDILIEEEDEMNIINPEYYQRLLKVC
jgi:hypothetical protein